DALLDIEFKGGDPRDVLDKQMARILSELARPDLSPEERSALKGVRNSIQGRIKAADADAESAIKDAQTAREKRIKDAGDRAKARAAKQRAGFDKLFPSLELQLDKAEVGTNFRKQREASKALERALTDQIKVEGRTSELVGKLFAQRQKTAEIIDKQVTAQQFR